MNKKLNVEEKPDWRKLEHLVANIQRELSPDAEVTHDVRIKGLLSERMRQIDVLVEQNIGQYTMRIIIDCKDTKKPIDVKSVEEFKGLIKDVGAHKGALVCPKGFTKTAKTLSKKLQIDLFSPVDTDPHKWQVNISLPVLCDFREAKFAFGIQGSHSKSMKIQPQFPNIEVFDKNAESLGKLDDVVRLKWDKGEFPTEIGEHNDCEIYNDETYIDNGYGENVKVELKVGVLVISELYFGYLSIDKMKGLKDENTGRIVTNAFQTKTLDPHLVQKNWEKVDKAKIHEYYPAFKVIGFFS